MQNLLKHILSWILAGIFLVSFTGLRLLIHHCMACESSDVYLFAQVDNCCEHHSHHHSDGNTCQLPVEEGSSCCSTGDAHCDNCCKDEVVYVKNEYEVSLDRHQFKIEPVEFELASILTTVLYGCESRESSFIPHKYYTPPPKWVGKDFVLYTHQLKTDHITFQA
jgi:hypothetical protein